jgi:predicted protein tyrosine phosphatase
MPDGIAGIVASDNLIRRPTTTKPGLVQSIMQPVDTFLPFRISVCGIEELAAHCDAGVSHVLSILDPDWPVPEAFGIFGEHAKLELRFHDVIEEHCRNAVTPQREHVLEVLTFGRRLGVGAHLLVHCHAGVSRSTASMALILAQACPDVSGARVFEEILRIRSQAWPNLRIVEFGDDALGRRGELVAAATEVYRRQLTNRRYSAEEMRFSGRAREIVTAID